MGRGFIQQSSLSLSTQNCQKDSLRWSTDRTRTSIFNFNFNVLMYTRFIAKIDPVLDLRKYLGQEMHLILLLNTAEVQYLDESTATEVLVLQNCIAGAGQPTNGVRKA